MNKSIFIRGATIIVFIMLVCSFITKKVTIMINKNERVVTTLSKENAEYKQDLNENNLNIEKFTSEIESIEKQLSDKNLILINKENQLSEDSIPEELQLAKIPFLDYIETRYLNRDASLAAEEMFDKALEEGIVLLGASGYRSYEVQVNLFNSRVKTDGEVEARKYTAIPGTSEHQTGLALDILSEEYQYLDEGFESSDSFNWLKNNCYKFGFILRYIKGKEDVTGYEYEPWHFRFIGNVEIAKEIMERNITLEEYIKELNEKVKLLQSKM